ncbi:MAG: type II toxin-antitoxin system RelE/ParE family toxin [Nitrospirae bacterium]|uniref:type II toxin-antitoxin system RelE family toxin n=1 Tax=Candidatus Magnetobacterium casense TaxID=1455061 RepID=UPI000590F488|nr:type II toxin-antitoxin system RelE/ParE family toxin [Candidatus Magnetobacterium casensis]MBF0337386.1 type II toxin-antitoxin system RelE/ParE family toxin [Nitrospirota bacterium]
MHKLIHSSGAERDIQRLEYQTFLRIDDAIHALKENPFPYPQSKKLVASKIRRLRVGDYRIFYTVDDDDKVVTILHVYHRKDAY